MDEHLIQGVLDATGTPSIFKIIRSAVALARILPISSLWLL
jgi:hypothetical protein